MALIAGRHRFGRVTFNSINRLKDKLVVMKQLKDRLPKQVDEALNEQARAAEGWATKTRSLFAIVFAASAIWTWNNPSNAKYVYLQLTAAWMVMAAVGAVLFTTAFVFMAGSRKPKDLTVNIAGKAIEEAFDLGARQKEIDLVQKAHQLFLPPPIADLPEIWVSSKHGAGTETGGDYFHI